MTGEQAKRGGAEPRSSAGSYNAAAWLVDRRIEAADGDRIAIRHGGVSITYADVQRDVWRAQHALAALGVTAGDRVAMVVNDEPAFVSWFLGCIRSGVVAVPLSTMLTPRELAAIVADSGARALVVSQQYASCVSAVADAAETVGHAVVLADDADARAAEARVAVHFWTAFDDRAEAKVADTVADSIAFWLYSSGTTGVPKGAMHRHLSMQATAETFGRTVLQITPEDRCLSVAKLFFAYGLGNSLTFPFSVGATAILESGRPTPESMSRLLVDERPTLFFASPGFVASLLDANVPPDRFASVRFAVTAGEALPAELHRRFRTHIGRPVLDGIGTTEALHMFMSNRGDDERPGTSGTPVEGYEVLILDDDGGEVTETDVPGKLHVRGPSIAAGYWQRPDVTATTFVDGWLRTGDVYTRTGDGAYRFLGRNNDMIKCGGMWVSPAEVESVLVEHAAVLEAAVVGDRTADGLETTVAFVVARAGHEIDVASIDAHCRERMAAFKRPRRVIVADELPKTATGKVRRFALRDELSRGRSDVS